MGRPNWQVAWTKRSPGTPILSRVKVAKTLPPVPPPQVDESLFASEFYGGLGATATVVYFPGDEPSVEEAFRADADAIRARPRSRVGPGIRVEAAVPQTVSNRRRAEVARIRAGLAVDTVIPGPGAATVPLASPESSGGGRQELVFASVDSPGPIPEASVFTPVSGGLRTIIAPARTGLAAVTQPGAVPAFGGGALGFETPGPRPVLTRIAQRIDALKAGGVTQAERAKIQTLRERRQEIKGG